MAPVERIHFIGGPGSGKTTLASRISTQLCLPYFGLDILALEVLPQATDPADVVAECLIKTHEIAQSRRWVTEGAYVGWTSSLLQRAELIVWMDVPWRVAGYRILARHIKASLRRNNRFPGLYKLYRFWRWSGRYYSSANPVGLNPWGTPNNRTDLIAALEGYREKVVPCHNRKDLQTVLDRLDLKSLN